MRYRFHFLVLLFSPVILFSQEPDIPRFGTPAKFTINTGILGNPTAQRGGL